MSVGSMSEPQISTISEAQAWCDEARRILGSRISRDRSGMEKRNNKVFEELKALRELIKKGKGKIAERQLKSYENQYIAIAKRAAKAASEGDKQGVQVESEQLSLLKKQLAVYLAAG